MRHVDTTILVFGPLYLDRVIRVDGPLLDPKLGLPPVDRSVDGAWEETGPPGGRIRLVDALGSALTVEPPPGYAGPAGTIRVSRPLAPTLLMKRTVRGEEAREDLGGMGAGFAMALGATLACAFGRRDDPNGTVLSKLMRRSPIQADAGVEIPDHPYDWTLLISSGSHGDKLAVGFRGCHAAWADAGPDPGRSQAWRARVVAALPNRAVGRLLGRRFVGPVRAFFPNARNMLDRDDPVAGFADRVDVLSCNRGEWDDLGDQVGALDVIPIVAVTDGPAGASVRFRAAAGGEPESIRVPAFPLGGPIVDTNRAGEAFAATLLLTLLEAGWRPGPADPELIRRAATRGSAASALVIQRAGFGFPTPDEVDEAVARGRA